jgi:hypothetical protein
MRKKLKFNFNCDGSGSKKCKREHGGSFGGVWRSLRLTVIWQSVLCSCVGQESGFSRREKVSTFNLLYKDIL